jgi:membrane fusion protein (multidrug efflux system)
MRIATLSCLLALALAACGQTKPKAAPPPPTVLVVPVAQRDVPLFIEAVASLDGYVNAEIRARVKGYLEAQKYKDGAAVKQGQPLFTIERGEYASALATARANLARAQTLVSHNRAQLERKQHLEASGVASKQELDDAQASAADAESQVLAARAQEQQAQLNLSYTEIRSPVSGVAGLALVRVGNLVGQDGPTLLTTVSQVDPIRVNVPISEVDFLKSPERFKGLEGRDLAWAKEAFNALEAGGAVAGDPGLELILADGSTYPRRGVIVAANRQVDPSTGTIQIQALFPNPDGILRPGQYGRIRLRRQDAGQNALVVPEKALIQVQGTYSLAVVGADNKVQQRRVEVGPSNGELRIINSGVAAGERVVIEGLQQARDGAAVSPQPVPAAAAATSAKD